MIVRDDKELEKLRPLSVDILTENFPELKTPVIGGLLRREEIANIIAPPKAGKSWLSYSIALAVATGTRWLKSFDTTAGRVLLIDNELHPETIAFRIPLVARALSLESATFGNSFDVLPLRGGLRGIYQLESLVKSMAGKYDLIIVDAFYRMLPEGISENSNSDLAKLYNTVDQYAATTGAAWVFIHHTSKGLQSDKSVTDVGAGAGSQSRAADTHLILRPHEEQDVVVLDAAVRSFPPITPIGLRWEFPLWLPDGAVDVRKLDGLKTKQETKQDTKDQQGIEIITQTLTETPWLTKTKLRDRTGIGGERLSRLLGKMHLKDLLIEQEGVSGGNKATKYALLGAPEF
ncbi:AAA family ATPase [Aeoliella sp.]|uniref:AAA family ATPase n=1 Tax=Aeoliella sp. TaxID=2795800 RepID=UPI003CCC1165